MGTRYVALLRGINVGGNNLIPMARLKAAFEAMGFDEVATYIASGNVLFSSPGTSAGLEARIERGLTKAFAYDAKVMVRSKAQLARVLAKAPKDWPRRNDLRRNVVFLKAPLTPRAAMAAAAPKAGVDTMAAGPGVVYFGTRKDAAAKSGLPKLVATKAYKLMTIRTYGTCETVMRLMEA